MSAQPDIRQIFFQECEEQLIELENGLSEMQAGGGDKETVNAVFRAVHSVKGGAGAFDLGDVVRFAHVFENTLDLVRTERLAPHPALLNLMLRATDVLADLIAAGREQRPADPARYADLVAELAAESGTPTAPVEADGPPLVFEPIAVSLDDFEDFLAFEPAAAGTHGDSHLRIAFKPHATLYEKGNETAVLFRELERSGAIVVTCDTGDVPPLDALDPDGAYFAWTIDLEGTHDEDVVREIFEFAEWDSEFSLERLTPSPSDAADGIAAMASPLEEPVVAVPEPHLVTPGLVTSDLVGPDLVPPPAASVETPAEGSLGPSGDKPADAKASAAATIRVDLVRVDRLIDLVGELVINQAMLTERVAGLNLPRMSPVAIGLDELEQLTREIQDSVMAIRAQPVKSVFQRLPRLVREVAAQTGKSVRLELEGEGTEVDKTVIERLVDPLTHMIRNAIDHGLETTEVRRQAGKPDEGVVRVSAAHRSGRISIEIADDGGGINRARVRSIAVEKGLIPADVKLSDEETDNLIFLPGFSTAEAISAISGRGVGMDVVRRSIQGLGGRISISSVPGQGSTFSLSLPLTLAVLDGMVVSVAEQTLVVPLSTVVEIMMPKAVQVHAVGASRVIGLRGEFLPLIDVGDRLGYRPAPTDPRSALVLLVESEGGARSALLVDAIQGQRQIVIKSLEANYSKVPGIAAATILGNGRVALILDVDAIIADMRGERFSTPLDAG